MEAIKMVDKGVRPLLCLGLNARPRINHTGIKAPSTPTPYRGWRLLIETIETPYGCVG
jgi:hypothetical protein